ncbi:UDP-Glycosyltransferase/glycogen phosphorylase [Thozetella sp. PMI_491]|nr:UDP-Glycosyltransferase/glycogen phosphorylase [Thozetella sp. PMI_491]
MAPAASPASAASGKPVVVMIAFPATGHTQGTIQMSEYLAKRGYDIYHIGGSAFKEKIQQQGVEYFENDHDVDAAFAKAQGLFGLDSLLSSMKHLFLDVTPKAYRLLKDVLALVKKRHPQQEVVIWHECMAGGLLPFYYGAPLPEGYDKLPRVVNFQSSIVTDRSDEVFPFGMGLPPVSNDQERAKCKGAWDGFIGALASVTDYANDIYKALGATEEMKENIFCRVMTIGDVTVFPYSQSLEFPQIQANSAVPTGSPGRKKIVFVSQGTACLNYEELILPTIRILKDRVDVLVIAALGARGAKLPDGFDIPSNARVADYVPYEAILPHADVFVSNAGFGGYLHGVMSGVPMVLAGTEADKADVCQRAEHAGVAINMRTQKPTEEALGIAVETIFTDPKYKARAVELMEENVALDGLATAEKHILGTAE